MTALKKYGSVLVLCTFTLSSIFSIGCTRYANQNQLSALDQAKAAAESAERAVVDCEGEMDSLQKELAAKKKELDDVKAEKEKVRQRLAVSFNSSCVGSHHSIDFIPFSFYTLVQCS